MLNTRLIITLTRASWKPLRTCRPLSKQVKPTSTTRKIYGEWYGTGESSEGDNSRLDYSASIPNHIWTREEIDHQLRSIYRHTPVTVSDKFMHTLMYSLYRAFNYITGYNPVDTSIKSMEWRLIVLESFAGVPGFVAAGFRHFRSLRRLERDYGWISTLLEEAENERTHLLVCLEMFKANWLTRMMVMAAQVTMTPFLMTVYAIKPGAMHRFVAYLEETACMTYASVIAQVERPGTELHTGWAHLPAPQIAKSYWRLPDNATFADTLKCMFEDESHHRDVNHTFAEMNPSDPNPFLLAQRLDALRDVALERDRQATWTNSAEKVKGIEVQLKEKKSAST